MAKGNNFLLLLSYLVLLFGCNTNEFNNSNNENINSPISSEIITESKEDIPSTNIESSFDETNSSETIEDSSIDNSSILNSSDELSDSSIGDVEDSASDSLLPSDEISSFVINSVNYNSFEGISYTNVAMNSKYSDELAISPSGNITMAGFEKVDSVIIHVYGTYDNLVVGSDVNSTINWQNKEVLGEGNKSSVKYTYNFNGGTKIIINNPSSYTVNAYSITVNYEGDLEIINLPDDPITEPLEQTTVGWTNTDYDNYYDSINTSLTGNDLLSALQTLNKKKQNRTVGYNGLWNYFSKTDYDPNNPSKYIAFYQGTSASKGEMNKEHVWPDSRGGNLVDGDLHMTRPTLTKDNSNRGNSFYVEGKNSTSSGWDPKAAGLNEIYRGIAARIIFYCAIANNNLTIIDSEVDAASNKTMGKLSDLLKWNLMYPVDYTEFNRNNGAQEVQGNRNPFIDNTSFACAIWGNTNASTKKICGSQVVENNNNNDQQETAIDNKEDKIIETPSYTTGDFVQIKSKDELSVDSKYIIVAKNNGFAAGTYTNSKYLASVAVNILSNKISELPQEVLVFDLKASGNYYNFSCSEGNLGAKAAKSLNFDNTANSNWNISFDEDGNAIIVSENDSYGQIKYNPSSPRFLNYSSSSNDMVQIQLFKQI